MKTALKSTALLLFATQAYAHTSALPHAHHGNETSWIPALGCAALTALAVFVVSRIWKSRKAQR